MKKRKRRYRCPLCKQVLLRVSDKKWMESYCEEGGRKARLQLVTKTK